MEQSEKSQIINNTINKCMKILFDEAEFSLTDECLKHMSELMPSFELEDIERFQKVRYASFLSAREKLLEVLKNN